MKKQEIVEEIKYLYDMKELILSRCAFKYVDIEVPDKEFNYAAERLIDKIMSETVDNQITVRI